MGRFTGILGLLTMLAFAYLLSSQPSGHSTEDGGLGSGSAIRLRGFRVAN